MLVDDMLVHQSRTINEAVFENDEVYCSLSPEPSISKFAENEKIEDLQTSTGAKNFQKLFAHG